MKKKIIIGISGASGVMYGVRALQHLATMDNIETHLIISDGAALNIAVETDLKLADIRAMADVVHSNDNLAAGIASGSYLADAMAVVPCSIKTLSGIANSYADNLLVRAADVTLKERRPLVLMVRETPLHKGHLELMSRAADYGAIILPPVPAFYQQPASVTDIIDQSVGKLFDCLHIEHDLMRRWGGTKSGTRTTRQ